MLDFSFSGLRPLARAFSRSLRPFITNRFRSSDPRVAEIVLACKRARSPTWRSTLRSPERGAGGGRVRGGTGVACGGTGIVGGAGVVDEAGVVVGVGAGVVVGVGAGVVDGVGACVVGASGGRAFVVDVVGGAFAEGGAGSVRGADVLIGTTPSSEGWIITLRACSGSASSKVVELG